MSNNNDERNANYDGLMEAVEAEDVEDVARILAVNPDVFSEDGTSGALEAAIKKDSFDLVKLLGDAGADVNEEASDGNEGNEPTPLMLDVAIKSGAHSAILAYLIVKGATTAGVKAASESAANNVAEEAGLRGGARRSRRTRKHRRSQRTRRH